MSRKSKSRPKLDGHQEAAKEKPDNGDGARKSIPIFLTEDTKCEEIG